MRSGSVVVAVIVAVCASLVARPASASPTLNVTCPSTPPVDFGVVQIGSSSSLDFQLTNTGDATLTFTSAVDFTGFYPGDFSVASSNPPASLAPGASTTLTVAFQPTGMGTRTANLRIQSNDPNQSTYLASLTGTGKSAITLSVSPGLPSIMAEGSTYGPFTVSTSNANPGPVTLSVSIGDSSNLPPPGGVPPLMAVDAGIATWTWTPGYSDQNAYTVTFSASDGVSLTGRSFSVYVANTDRPPTITFGSIPTFVENQPASFTVTASDPDGDPLSPSNLTFDVASDMSPAPADAGPSFTVVQGTNASTVVGTLSWTPASTDAEAGGAANPSTTFSLNFHATDGYASSSADAGVTVVDVDVPTFTISTGAPSISASAGDLVTFDITAQDADLGQALSLSLQSFSGSQQVSFPPAAVTTSTANGGDATSTFTWQTGAGDTGAYAATFAASDGHDTTTFQVAISLSSPASSGNSASASSSSGSASGFSSASSSSGTSGSGASSSSASSSGSSSSSSSAASSASSGSVGSSSSSASGTSSDSGATGSSSGSSSASASSGSTSSSSSSGTSGASSSGASTGSGSVGSSGATSGSTTTSSTRGVASSSTSGTTGATSRTTSTSGNSGSSAGGGCGCGARGDPPLWLLFGAPLLAFRRRRARAQA